MGVELGNKALSRARGGVIEDKVAMIKRVWKNNYARRVRRVMLGSTMEDATADDDAEVVCRYRCFVYLRGTIISINHYRQRKYGLKENGACRNIALAAFEFPKDDLNMKELKMESWSKTNWRSSPHRHSQWLLASHGPSSPRNTCFGSSGATMTLICRTAGSDRTGQR